MCPKSYSVYLKGDYKLGLRVVQVPIHEGTGFAVIVQVSGEHMILRYLDP